MNNRNASNHGTWRTIAQVAEYLQVNERTVRRWIGAGGLAAHRFGRQWRISTKDLGAFLDSRRHGAIPDAL